MARRRYDEPDDADEGDDYGDDERSLIGCPHCRAEIDEESVRCPRCGTYISEEDSPREGKSAAWVVLMVLALLAALSWTLGR